MRVRMAGYGGQGQVTAGILLGHAAVLDDRNALQTQAYGSATRGGLTTCDIAIADGDIHEVNPEEFDVLVAFCQEAADTFLELLSPDGVLVYEADLVTLPEGIEQRTAGAATTRLAKTELGRQICANVLMLGFLVGSVPEVVSEASAEQALSEQLAPRIVEMNLEAFRLGATHGAAARG
jgi:2-oxoglutarate ferredoxin oxidoreductase subunit gamma